MFMSELDEAKYIEKTAIELVETKSVNGTSGEVDEVEKSLRFYDVFLTFKNTGMRFGQKNCQMTLLDAKTSLRF